MGSKKRAGYPGRKSEHGAPEKDAAPSPGDGKVALTNPVIDNFGNDHRLDQFHRQFDQHHANRRNRGHAVLLYVGKYRCHERSSLLHQPEKHS
ncbi:hypothetical protein D1872_263720 [compost metagenome]